MYNVTNDFLLAVKQPSRVIKAKVVINGTTTLDEATIMNLSVERSLSGNMPVLGSVSAAKMTLGLINSGLPQVLIGVPIVPSVAIEVTPGIYEWIQLGKFYATAGDVTKTARSLNIECFDKMPDYDDMSYGSSLTYPATLEAIKNEITSNYGISFATQTLPAVTFAAAPAGTVRQVLSELALNLSCNAVVNATGLVEFVGLKSSGFAMDANHYIDFKLNSEAPVKLSQIAFKKGDTVIHAGDGSGYALSIESSNITDQGAADAVYNRVYPLTVTAYKLKSQGMPHLQLGDSFTFTDADSVTRTLIVANHKLSFSGGLISEFTVDAPKADVVETAPTGGAGIVSRAITQASANMMIAVNEATKLITGATGGVVVTNFDENGKPKEQLILDTGDINTALRVWRWNLEGLGYSSDGYLGPYKLAITSAGKINADFITTGTLSASLIKAGMIQSPDGQSYWNLDTGEIALNVTSLKISSNPVATQDDVDQSAADATNAAITESTSQFEIRENGIYTKISDTYLTQNDFGQFKEKYDYERTETGKGYTDTFTELRNKVDAASGEVTSEFEKLQKYIQYDGNITLGQLGSKITLKLQNDRLSFYSGSGTDAIEVAYFNDNKLYIRDGQFLETLRLGNFAFTPRTNGNLSFGRIN